MPLKWEDDLHELKISILQYSYEKLIPPILNYLDNRRSSQVTFKLKKGQIFCFFETLNWQIFH